MRSLCALIALSLTGLASACQTPTTPTAPPGLDDYCTASGLDCEEGDCYLGAALANAAPNTCQITCTTSADCPTGRLCSVASDGARVCAELDCENDPDGSIYCIDGAPTACQQAPCGCSCPMGQYCPDGLACVPQRGAGESCAGDRDCATGACMPSGVCQVEVGAACTTSNCARCMGTGPNAFCSRSCSPSSDPSMSSCPDDMGCLNLIGNYPGDYDAVVCRPECTVDGDCPEGWGCNSIYVPDLGRDFHYCYDDAEYARG